MPLTTGQTAIITATVPILETGGETLTKHFYENMLRDYPVVLPFFNAAHQKSGDQPRALARAVLMYAKNIEKLEGLGPLVNQIVTKHVSLNINPAHYDIVGSCLLKAIREVLGEEVANDDVIDAWGAAYGQLAAILIGAEAGVMKANAELPGGWLGSREFVVKAKVPESSEITSFHLAPADGGAIMTYEAGQYLGLHLFVGDKEVRRNYSISSAANGDHYRISVKREPGGLVSNHLHDDVAVGHTINLYPPTGDFTLKAAENTKPIVFLTAGVGITPALAMLQETIQQVNSTRPVRFIHCAKTTKCQAFRDAVLKICAEHPNVTYYTSYSQEKEESAPVEENVKYGRLTQAQLGAWLPMVHDAEVFLLGPKSFMVDMKKSLINLGAPEKQLHWEFFGPASDLN